MARRVAVDIGGTFTDLAAVDENGRLTLTKADTTPSSPDQGAVTALERSGIAPADITTFVHGTTVVINAVTERKGATTALLTTEGFRDVLEIGRANRPDLYNLAYRKPRPFVPRRRRYEVRERMDHRGRELTPLDEAALTVIADRRVHVRRCAATHRQGRHRSDLSDPPEQPTTCVSSPFLHAGLALLADTP